MSMGIQSFDNLHDNRVLRYCADFEAHRDQLPVLLTEAVHSAERASQNAKVEKWCKES